MPRWPSSVRARLTLWYTVLLGLPLVAFALLSYAGFAAALVSGTDRFVRDALGAFTRELGAERRTGLSIEDAMRTTVTELRFRELGILVLAGERVVAMANQPAMDSMAGGSGTADAAIALERMKQGGALPLTFTNRDGPVPVRLRVDSLVVEGRAFTLVAWYPMRESERMLEGIRRLFAIAIPLLLVVAATSGSFLAQRSLAPVTAMASRAAEISANNLHERLPVGGGDELVRLARVINDLLDRLQASFDQQLRFMADASHELRTPTAIVRTEADVTLSRAHRDETEYRASIGIMQDATRRLTRIVDDLFLLGRADAGHLVVQRTAMYLEDVVDGAARGVRQLADARGVRVELSHLVEAQVQGDADLLGRVMLNLLDNAIKHSPEAGVVGVSMATEDSQVAVSVIDAGPGIPAEARDRVFDRFFRADASRSREETGGTSGAGLGLAIARRIAEAHGGRLDLVDTRPGHTEFRMVLPIDRTGASV